MPFPQSQRALVLFSGGQDSTTCLAWALKQFSYVETIGFDYGQRHHIELLMRPILLEKIKHLSDDWQQKLGQDHVLDLSLLGKLSETALTRNTAIEWEANQLPNTFVPGRNLLFLLTAAIVATRRGLTVLVGGMCETDFSGYPDCRNESIVAMQTAINLGMANTQSIATPLMWINKAQTWKMAQDLGGQALIDLILEETHTCYLGERGQRHEWGYGCGQCPACQLRAQGWFEFQKNTPSFLKN